MMNESIISGIPNLVFIIIGAVVLISIIIFIIIALKSKNKKRIM